MDLQTPSGLSGQAEQGLWWPRRPARDAPAGPSDEELRSIVLNGLPGWQEALQELLKGREVPIEPWVIRLTDEQLRFIIVNQLPSWQRAYDELLIERYGDVVKAVARRFNPRALGLERPDDLHNELYLHLRGKQRTWGPLRSWDPEKGPFSPWLWKVVQSLCHDLVEHETRQRGKGAISLDKLFDCNKEEGIPWGELIPDPGADPEGKFIEDEMERLKRGCLRKSLARLDPKDQRIIALSFFFGLTDGEIAEELGMARETVNRRKRAAIQKLNAYMNECLEGVL